MKKKADTTTHQTPEATGTQRLPNAIANALMTILAIAVFILFLPVALIVWQYDRHFKV